MRGDDPRHESMFSYVTPEQRVRADHPLRPIRRMTDTALTRLSSRFDRLYSTTGRPSIPPEQLLRALLLQMLYSIRSERLLVEELDYSVLYRWFVGLSLDDPMWDATTFTKNRDRLLAGDIADAFFAEVLAAIQADGLLSDEHFTVDGTLLEAWASQKSFKPKAGPRTPPDDPSNPTVNFHGQTRRNDTHQSTTDPDARLYRKADGRESRLCFMGHVLMENRNGLALDAALTRATGTAEREAALSMLDRRRRGGRVTLGTDKAYDVTAFVQDLRERTVTPHIAVNGVVSKRGVVRRTAVDGRTTRHAGYAFSQRVRKRIEEVFGWIKAQAGFAKVKVRGCAKAEAVFTFAVAAYNLIRIPKLLAQAST